MFKKICNSITRARTRISTRLLIAMYQDEMDNTHLKFHAVTKYIFVNTFGYGYVLFNANNFVVINSCIKECLTFNHLLQICKQN